MAAVDQPLAARIGLDWASAHHDMSLCAAGSDTFERQRIAHTPEALRDWVGGLRRRFQGCPVGICLEISRGPLVHALEAGDGLGFYITAAWAWGL